MNPTIKNYITTFNSETISDKRKVELNKLVDYLKDKLSKNEKIQLNFICTHNSRRSHLSQIWAQVFSDYFGFHSITTFSGGTEATALFPKVAETLSNQGFEIIQLSESSNPVYAVKHSENSNPIICFSKVYNDRFNPQSAYCAILTCDSADEACPVVIGAEKRIPIKFEDPKKFDNTPEMDAKYIERSLEIAQEMWFVFFSLSH